MRYHGWSGAGAADAWTIVIGLAYSMYSIADDGPYSIGLVGYDTTSFSG